MKYYVFDNLLLLWDALLEIIPRPFKMCMNIAWNTIQTTFLLDFEKTFDSIECTCLYKTFKHANNSILQIALLS